jgi:hypothetical protein
VLAHEVTLLERDGVHDVKRRAQGEVQVRDRHRGRHPESEQPTHVKRMADEAVEAGRGERDGRVRQAAELEPHLTEPEQIEVVDEERGYHREPPAEREESEEQAASDRRLDDPDRTAERLPRREEEPEREARKEDVRRALDRHRHDLRPALFEPRARHHAVLHREEREQTEIDGEPDRERHARFAVERSRNLEVADETDRVENRPQKDQVTRNAVRKERDSLHHDLLLLFGR